MTVTLVLPWALADELAQAALADTETAGVLVARRVSTPEGNLRLLVRKVRWAPEDAYLERTSEELKVSSSGYVPALAEAEADNAMAIWFHTHTGENASTRPSRRDELVDLELADLFRLRSGAPLYGSLVITAHGRHLRFSGHVEDDRERYSIDRLLVSGPRLSLIRNSLHSTLSLPDQFDRNIRAFGGDIQRVLGDLTIAIVGCGGTGSAVAEQLVRLGVRSFHLLDPDTLSASNVTRVYGSFPELVGKPKVDVLADHMRRIAPDATVSTHLATITRENGASALIDADVVFGCTDDNAGRLVLSRIATYMATPVIDCGVLLTSGPDGVMEGIYGRVTVIAPGSPCLVCRGRIDLRRAAAEMLTPEEHSLRASEGYAPALGATEPAVVAYTSYVAAASVGELLERLIKYGPEPPPSETLLRLHDRETSTNHSEPREGHYCHPESLKTGLGITEPFLEQTWPE